jgi:hypothetical protein
MIGYDMIRIKEIRQHKNSGRNPQGNKSPSRHRHRQEDSTGEGKAIPVFN